MIFKKWFKKFLNLWHPEFSLRLSFKFSSWLYRWQNFEALRYGRNTHPKHRLIRYHDFFVDNLSAGQKVLDIGSGKGELAKDMAECVSEVCVLALELQSRAVEHAKEYNAHPRVEYVVADALNYQFEESVDVIVMSNVLEHIEKRVEFLKKIVAQCRPKYLLIRVPMYERDWCVPFQEELGIDYRLDNTHFIEYKLPELRAELVLAGLRIEYMEINWGEYWLKAIPD